MATGALAQSARRSLLLHNKDHSGRMRPPAVHRRGSDQRKHLPKRRENQLPERGLNYVDPHTPPHPHLPPSMPAPSPPRTWDIGSNDGSHLGIRENSENRQRCGGAAHPQRSTL